MTLSSMRALVLLICLLTGLNLFACESAPSIETLNEPLLKEFERDTLTITTAAGKSIPFAVYLAKSDEQMRQGLMFVRELPRGVGMLFPYRQQRIGGMWMKNTFIPLDILFINARGEITDIHIDTTPQSLKSIRSSGKVKGALELIGGSTERFGIAVGDRVEHRHFGSDNSRP